LLQQNSAPGSGVFRLFSCCPGLIKTFYLAESLI
jgi:hypothetical protein